MRIVCLYLFLLLLLLSLSINAQTTGYADGKDESRLTGKIIDEIGTSLVDVSVEFYYRDLPQTTYKALSDKSGKFALSIPKKAGECRLIVDKNGCGKVVRSAPSYSNFLEAGEMTITMICSYHTPKYSFQGKVLSGNGFPLAGVNIKICAPPSSDNVICKTVSDKNGLFSIIVPEESKGYVLRAETPGSSLTVRTFANIAKLAEKDALNITVYGVDPPLPIQTREHKRLSENTDIADYVGKYQITYIYGDIRNSLATIELYKNTVNKDGSCNCENRMLAVITNRQVIPGCCGIDDKGCWSIKDNGDLKITFGCQRAIFAGEVWTLWKEEDRLVGYGGVLSDVGSSINWELILTPIAGN